MQAKSDPICLFYAMASSISLSEKERKKERKLHQCVLLNHHAERHSLLTSYCKENIEILLQLQPQHAPINLHYQNIKVGCTMNCLFPSIDKKNAMGACICKIFGGCTQTYITM